MDFLNAIILLLNYIFVPALTYGSQLAIGAIFVTVSIVQTQFFTLSI